MVAPSTKSALGRLAREHIVGDRGNIVLNQESDTADAAGIKPQRIFLYAHWDGYRLPRTLQEALIKASDEGSQYPQSRWGDESYLGRIIFQQMINDADGITGYGISTYQGDGEHPLLVVDSDKQTVHLEALFSDDRAVTHGPWTFEQYVAMDLCPNDDDYETWNTLTGGAE
jgi:hypothetical protein